MVETIQKGLLVGFKMMIFVARASINLGSKKKTSGVTASDGKSTCTANHSATWYQK
jgi:hypothetical protein